jgi:regulatory protein
VAGHDEPQADDDGVAAAKARRQAFDRGLRSLAGREHSQAELLRKLAVKGVAKELAREVVDELCEHGFQSDERFAASFVRGRVERGYGPIWIRQALQQRGVDGELIESLLDQPREYWQERAEAARSRKFGAEPPADRPEWQRQARFLAQRGFSNDLIVRVLERRG